MNIEVKDILGAIAIGVGATLIMDFWNLFLKRTFNISSLSYCLLGRWLRYMPEGVFRHASIASAQQRPHECTIGWIAHYAIGITFAVMFILLTSGDWLAVPTVLPALIYGIGTVAIPYFIMQPALGFGMAMSKAPKPMQARLKSLGTHTVFGLGLYVCAMSMTYLQRVLVA